MMCTQTCIYNGKYRSQIWCYQFSVLGEYQWPHYVADLIYLPHLLHRILKNKWDSLVKYMLKVRYTSSSPTPIFWQVPHPINLDLTLQTKWNSFHTLCWYSASLTNVSSWPLARVDSWLCFCTISNQSSFSFHVRDLRMHYPKVSKASLPRL